MSFVPAFPCPRIHNRSRVGWRSESRCTSHKIDGTFLHSTRTSLAEPKCGRRRYHKAYSSLYLPLVYTVCSRISPNSRVSLSSCNQSIYRYVHPQVYSLPNHSPRQCSRCRTFFLPWNRLQRRRHRCYCELQRQQWLLRTSAASLTSDVQATIS